MDAARADTVTAAPAPPRAAVPRGSPPPGADPDVWSLLCRCRALAPLSPDALCDLYAASIERSFRPGDALMTQGDPADGLVIVLEGTAHATLRAPGSDDRSIGAFVSGDVVGEMALVTREPRSATVVADSGIRALFVPTAAFDQLAARHPELGAVLTELVADRLGRGAHDGFGGKKVEGFRIVRCVGRGGMSVVYRALEESTGEHVALKMMSYRLIYDVRALERFHQEASILQRLNHENIARLKRLFPAYFTYFLVMELCEGVDLHRLTQWYGRLNESQVRPILGQLARALDYVHRRSLVHRDLKPANVMMTRDGTIKLTDFGLAVPAFGSRQRSEANGSVVIGTPAFMAPEQLVGGEIGRRTDIYALGCLAFDLLTGHHLFGARSVQELVQEKLTKQLPPAAEIGDGISEELYAFLRYALRVTPDERPPSVAPLARWAAPCDPPPQRLLDEPDS